MQAAKKINLSVLQVVLTWLLLLALPASSLATYSLTPQASAPEQRVTSAETRIGQILVLDANCTGVDGVLILISTRVADDVGWKTATDRPEGRFWNADSYEGIQMDPASLHKYLYANADPVNRIDPSGRFGIGEVASVSSIVGIVSGIVSGTIKSQYGGGSFWEGFFEGFISGFVYTAVTLVAPGLSPYLPGIIAQVTATVVMGIYTGEIKSDPAAFGIKLGLSIVIGAGLQGTFGKLGLDDAYLNLATEIAKTGFKQATKPILVESGKTTITAVISGVAIQLPTVFTDLVVAMRKEAMDSSSTHTDRLKEALKLTQ